MKTCLCILLVLGLAPQVWAGIPATPVMTLYRFNGDLDIPYYTIETFQQTGPSRPAGSLAQGTSLIPCLVLRNGRPLTDSGGTPYVGFTVVVDSRTATRAATATFNSVRQQRQAMRLANHHCEAQVRYVIDIRQLFDLEKAPFFDPPLPSKTQSSTGQARGELDQIIRAFHHAPQCDEANRRLIGRRDALQQAWEDFIRAHQGRWSGQAMQHARHLDYTLRTTLFEGHLERGCNAYGACERNIIALSIRNRAITSCLGRQGCRAPGDFQGVASKTSQYNIWDEYLTQISGLTACFLRQDLVRGPFAASPEHRSQVQEYSKLQGMYEQSLDDVQRILFGDDQDLRTTFPGIPLAELQSLRHYYHAPAMGKCFPNHDRVEYISGAVASKGQDFALLANTRIHVDTRGDGGYAFREVILHQEPERDVLQIVDTYAGFVVDERKVSLRPASQCSPYGIPPGCRVAKVERYRKTPPWLQAGKPLALTCRVLDRGATCEGKGSVQTATVGDVCDTQMRPVAGVD